MSMKTTLPHLGVAALAVGCPLAVFAAAGDERRGLSVSDVLIPMLPVLVILVLFAFLPRFMKKQAGMQRYEEHMQRVEAQLKRIADALEKRDKDDDHAA